MILATELHSRSMDIAELALLSRLRNNHHEADRLFRESLKHELDAIDAMRNEPLEPTFSILHRSAATLALDCNDLRLAEKLITAALSNEPPNEIADELRDLLEQVYFRRHLKLRGVCLEEDELQMSLAGEGVGFGVVQSNEFLERVEKASKLIYRIVDRRNGKSFGSSGRSKKSIKDDYEVFLSVPRAASFAVTLKLGRPNEQRILPGMSDTAELLDEFMNLMGLLNKGDYPSIESAIPDPAYRLNFIQLGKRLAPDGKKVTMVGFTTMSKGQERTVAVSRTPSQIPDKVIDTASPEHELQMVTVYGVLKFADATHSDSGKIRIIDEGKKGVVHYVKVPEGMMGDIVKPLWDCRVVVKGKKDGKFIILEDINEQ